MTIKFQQINKKSRIESDNYQTPKEALDCLIPYLKKKWLIWECACGNKNLVNRLEGLGFKVVGSDIKTRTDFLKQTLVDKDFNSNFDCIITNPPYSLKDKFIERSYELKKPFALLMPLTALEGIKRQKLYINFGLQLIIFNKRICFELEDGTKTKGNWFASAWFTNGLNLPKDINFVGTNERI